MIVFVFYLLKASVCLSIFYGFYHLVLSNSSFHQWNRYFLLGTIVASLVIPLVPTPGFVSTHTLHNPQVLLSDFQNLVNAPQNTPTSAAHTPWLIGILCIYSMGAVYFMSKLVLDLRKVFVLIGASNHNKVGKQVLIETQQLPSSSFFGYIFINRKGLSEEEIQQVIRHEQVHSHEKHSIDVLLLCLLQVFFWFNPLIGYLRKSIEELHEYQVDAQVVQHLSIPQYSRLLLQLATKPGNIQLTSSFSKIQLKKRIIMLNKTKTSNTRKFRFLFAAPLAVCMVMLFASTGQAQKRHSLVGNWQGVEVTIRPLKQGVGVNPKIFEAGKKVHQSTHYQLSQDGSLVVNDAQGQKTGTWKLKGKFLETSIGLGKMEVTQLSNNKLHLKALASLRTGGPATNKQDADFEIVYIFNKK